MDELYVIGDDVKDEVSMHYYLGFLLDMVDTIYHLLIDIKCFTC